MENIGSGELTLPEQEMHTTAFWLTLPRDLMASLPYGATERLDGVNGLANALEAVAALLVMCDARDLGRAVGENPELEKGSQESEERSQESGARSQKSEVDSEFDVQNSEERSQESGVRSQNEDRDSAEEEGGDQSDRRAITAKATVVAFEPNIYLYDKYPGGVGLSEPLFRMSDSLLEKTQKLISSCPCPNGCPSCVGPIGEVGEKGKEVALEILRKLSVVSGQ